MYPLSPDFEVGRGAHFAIVCFFLRVGWSNLLIFTDFQLPLLFLSSSPNLQKYKELTGSALLKTGGLKQGNRILGKAKLCALLNCASPRLKPQVLSKAVSCDSSAGLEGRREDIIAN